MFVLIISRAITWSTYYLEHFSCFYVYIQIIYCSLRFFIYFQNKVKTFFCYYQEAISHQNLTLNFTMKHNFEQTLRTYQAGNFHFMHYHEMYIIRFFVFFFYRHHIGNIYTDFLIPASSFICHKQSFTFTVSTYQSLSVQF